MGEKMNKNFVSYADFGAFGDGKHNDFFAIKKAHEYANLHNLPVFARYLHLKQFPRLHI